MLNCIISQLEAIKEAKPLVHHITNYVTVNDCANACLAIGASPIMADEATEVCDITAIASSLVINIGTLNERTVASMLKAGMKANECGIPVVLDPVGAGASGFRNETAAKLLENIRFTVIRGNLSEIRYLTENCANTKGVDVSDKDMGQSSVDIAMRCAKKYGCIAAITGKTDVISDGQKVLCIDNGHEALSSVTGTGCMCTTLIGVFCGANSDPFVSAAGGILSMGIAGELAFERAGSLGFGSFRIALMDEIGKLNGTTILERAKIHEKAC